MSRYWPLDGLRVRTDRLELRLPTADDLDALGDRAAEGVHGPEIMPFPDAWTDQSPEDRARAAMRYHWTKRAAWSTDYWALHLVTVLDGVVVGAQMLAGRDFTARLEVYTGSWLGRRYQGRGIGTEMRAAVLYLAFAKLGAEYAISGAYEDNTASLRVSEKTGYHHDGTFREVVRGRVQREQLLRVDRAEWERHNRYQISVEGLEPCLPMFGLGQ